MADLLAVHVGLEDRNRCGVLYLAADGVTFCGRSVEQILNGTSAAGVRSLAPALCKCTKSLTRRGRGREFFFAWKTMLSTMRLSSFFNYDPAVLLVVLSICCFGAWTSAGTGR
jgi:hypothetical protein